VLATGVTAPSRVLPVLADAPVPRGHMPALLAVFVQLLQSEGRGGRDVRDRIDALSGTCFYSLVPSPGSAAGGTESPPRGVPAPCARQQECDRPTPPAPCSTPTVFASPLCGFSFSRPHSQTALNNTPVLEESRGWHAPARRVSPGSARASVTRVRVPRPVCNPASESAHPPGARDRGSSPHHGENKSSECPEKMGEP